MEDLISYLRTASRKLVWEWGFLRHSLPETALAHVAVHCLIEIGDSTSPPLFSELCTELQVTQGDFAPVVLELMQSGYITLVPNNRPPPKDGRKSKEDNEGLFSLTPMGIETLHKLNAYAQNQIAKALQVTHPTLGTEVTTALSLYAAALEISRKAEADPIPELTPIASPIRELSSPNFPPPEKPTVRIVTGYIPGLLGRTLEMNSTYYWDLVQWGSEFESDLGAGIADLIKRLDNPLNQAWSVVRTISPPTPGKLAQERIEGVIYVDGECSGEEGVAKIRAFILDDSVRGMGLGKRMVSEAMKFVRESGFRECRLTTMRMLAPAIRLYENEGFVETGEQWESHWGKGHMALHFTWRSDQDPKTDQQRPKRTEP